MREITFRAWNKESKEFIYSDWKYGVVSFWDEIVNDYTNKYENVQQFTGCVDKNKKRIFKGDTLKSKHFNTGRKQYYLYHMVMWDDKYLCWKVVSVGNPEGYDITVHGNPQLWVYLKNVNNSHEVFGHEYSDSQPLTSKI